MLHQCPGQKESKRYQDNTELALFTPKTPRANQKAIRHNQYDATEEMYGCSRRT